MSKMVKQGLLLVVLTAISVFSYPVLQLDIEGGEYLSSDPSGIHDVETIVAKDNVFSLYALLNTSADEGEDGGGAFKGSIDSDFYLSIAISPKLDQVGGNFGSFKIDGVEVDVTDGMTYGTPPLDETIKDIGGHGIFDTYYKEIAFKFDLNNTCLAYNSQDDAGGIDDGTGFFYNDFVIDVSNLNPNYLLHFDLYDDKVKKNGDITLGNVAPFSHDAESAPASVPEPTTTALLGVSLLLLGFLPKRKKR